MLTWDWAVAKPLLVSALLSGVIGLERAWRGKAAGLRTHMLVCVGSSLIMLISVHVAKSHPTAPVDPSRIASNVVTGLGFLGAGTIIVSGGVVHGLTTAASLWAVGAIGLAVGSGFYTGAVYAWMILGVALHVLDRLEAAIVRGVGPRARSWLARLLRGG